MTKNIMIVGVGGQGSLLASKLLGHVLLSQNYDVKVSEVHGMSQRGGSVVTYVRYGDKVYSPIIDKGQADVIISFEKLEAARYMNYLKKGGKIVVSDQEIDPMPVITGAAEIFLPLYAKPVDGYIYSVSLIEYVDNEIWIRMTYWGLFIALTIIGIVNILMVNFKFEKGKKVYSLPQISQRNFFSSSGKIRPITHNVNERKTV